MHGCRCVVKYVPACSIFKHLYALGIFNDACDDVDDAYYDDDGHINVINDNDYDDDVFVCAQVCACIAPVASGNEDVGLAGAEDELGSMPGCAA